MKRIIALCLLFAMGLSFCACNKSETNNESSLEDELINEKWVAVLDYSLTSNRVMYFDEDGTGVITSESGRGGDIEWTIRNDSVSVEYRNADVIWYYTFDVDNQYGYTRLVDDEYHAVFVPENNLTEATTDLKNERMAMASELDWVAAHKLKISNEAQYDSKYVGQVWQWTATVYEVGSIYCGMAVEVYKGLPHNEILVYMDPSELSRISVGSTITVNGILNGYSDKLYYAFVVE